MRIKFFAAALATSFITALTGGAAASNIPWSNASGETADFYWSNGRTDNGRFGDPTVVGNSFVFFPSNFKAESSNGTAAQVSDRLAFTLLMKPHADLLAVTMHEAGDYAILGSGTVNAQGGLFVKNLNSTGLVSATMVSNPVMPYTSATSSSGLWEGTANAVVPAGWTMVEVVFNNILQATSDQGTAAAIEKMVAEPIVVTFVIPEPASASLLLMGFGVALVRRTRRVA